MTTEYTYRGYTIDVRCEHKVGAAGFDVTLDDDAPRGYIAVVQIRATNVPSFFLAPIRLADDHGKLFADGLDALRAGRSAGEIIVDDLLVGTCEERSAN
ncbi:MULTISPECIES: hydrogenase maturation factor [unclassified Burkholderia]|uniref:hydrogenase maturation factor n=1 Tax=unclassified Burkholderia TaxID=2613784 RepID=UPI001423506D|nr:MULTISPECIES: hydrogenase maturation factor [unclassified Burkholderia]NIE57786.1 hydrogenase maturation factor [Burkholderia sp. Ap-955]NIF10769.1 hydrogenase maturation factor [Burkholderia sp. Ax-1735]NIG02507.1 hydrogenase maturation factor [Burkholderia sp. Tr-849]